MNARCQTAVARVIALQGSVCVRSDGRVVIVNFEIVRTGSAQAMDLVPRENATARLAGLGTAAKREMSRSSVVFPTVLVMEVLISPPEPAAVITTGPGSSAI